MSEVICRSFSRISIDYWLDCKSASATLKGIYGRSAGALRTVSTSRESGHSECLRLCNGQPCKRLVVPMWGWKPSLDRVDRSETITQHKYRVPLNITLFREVDRRFGRTCRLLRGMRIIPFYPTQRSFQGSQILSLFPVCLTVSFRVLIALFPPRLCLLLSFRSRVKLLP